MGKKQGTAIQNSPATPVWHDFFPRHERLLAFLLGFAAMAYVQGGSYYPSGRDSFYHIKMAVLLPEIGFPSEFHWLRHTIFNDTFVSHHHGFHIMLVPFVHGSAWLAEHAPTWLVDWSGGERPGWFSGLKGWTAAWLESPYLYGAKALSCLLFGLVVLAIDLIMRRLDVGMRWFWLLAVMALPADFFLRMSYIRAPIVSLLILLLVVYLCIQHRPVWVGLLGVIYCHVYGGFVFYPLVVGVAVAVQFTRGPKRSFRQYAPLLAACIVGTAAGVLTHPYFPEHLAFLKLQLFDTGLQTSAVQNVRVGSEWQPIHLDYWLQMSAFLLTLFGASLVFRANLQRLLDVPTLTLMILNIVFLVLCLTARRFIEYWPVFCLLSAAAMWRELDRTLDEIHERSSEGFPKPFIDITSFLKRSYVALLLLVVCIGSVTLWQARKAARCKFDIPTMRRALAFLETTSEPGSLIFADDWDVFPMYFFLNHHNDYVCGLDPQFTNTRWPALWERYCVITRGRAPRNSSVRVPHETPDGQLVFESTEIRIALSDIHNHFEADYVIVDQDHGKFYDAMAEAPELFEYLYPVAISGKPPTRQPKLAIFKVLAPAPGSP